MTTHPECADLYTVANAHDWARAMRRAADPDEIPLGLLGVGGGL